MAEEIIEKDVKKKNKRPFFSISVPIYNAEEHLDECIQSIIDQTFSDYELILVDDGSTDESVKICEKWREIYPDKIKIRKGANNGSLLTRRKCIAESTGKYIYIMDADDYLIDKDMLVKAKRILKTTMCDMYIFQYTKDCTSRQPEINFPFEKNKVYNGKSMKEIYRYIVETDNLNCLWNKIIKRELIDTGDYKKWKKLCIGTDRFQLIPLITKAKKVIFVKDTCYYYRTTPNSIVHSFNKNLIYSLRLHQDQIENYSRQWRLDDLNSLLATRFMFNASSVAYKARLISSADNIEKKTFLSSIKRIDYFEKYYKKANYKELGIARTIIIKMIHYEKYNLLSFFLKIISKKEQYA